jgi:hypothetical protein
MLNETVQDADAYEQTFPVAAQEMNIDIFRSAFIQPVLNITTQHKSDNRFIPSTPRLRIDASFIPSSPNLSFLL